jgi:hypothetical protein
LQKREQAAKERHGGEKNNEQNSEQYIETGRFKDEHKLIAERQSKSIETAKANKEMSRTNNRLPESISII